MGQDQTNLPALAGEFGEAVARELNKGETSAHALFLPNAGENSTSAQTRTGNPAASIPYQVDVYAKLKQLNGDGALDHLDDVFFVGTGDRGYRRPLDVEFSDP